MQGKQQSKLWSSSPRIINFLLLFFPRQMYSLKTRSHNEATATTAFLKRVYLSECLGGRSVFSSAASTRAPCHLTSMASFFLSLTNQTTPRTGNNVGRRSALSRAILKTRFNSLESRKCTDSSRRGHCRVINCWSDNN